MLAGNRAAAVAAGATGTVTVSLGKAKFVTAISIVGSVATAQEIGTTFLSIGGKNSEIPAGVELPWSGIVNTLGGAWYRFPRPINVETATVQVQAVNNNAAASDIVVTVETV